jgi:hypothetical protein
MQPDGRNASSTDPATWSTLDECQKAVRKGDFGGVGFVLGPRGDGFTVFGLDFDCCVREGSLLPWVKPFVDLLDGKTWLERSLSGYGLKMLGLVRDSDIPQLREAFRIADAGRNVKPFKETINGKQRSGGVEIYLRDRYFTVTGDLFHSATDVELFDAAAIDALGCAFAEFEAAYVERPQDGKAALRDDEKAKQLEAQLRKEAAESISDLTDLPIALLTRFKEARLRHRGVLKRWNNDREHLSDQSDSALDMALAGALRHASFDTFDTACILLAFPHGQAHGAYAHDPHRRVRAAARAAAGAYPPERAFETEAASAAIVDEGLPVIIGFDQIPPRQWAYGRFLMFGAAAVLGATDGTGKGFVTATMILALVTGRPLLGEKVWRSGAVGIITYEDDPTEWLRRLAAACIHHNIKYDDIRPHIFFLLRPGGRVVLAQRGLSKETIYPDSDAIIEKLKARKAVALVIDPFNSVHEMDDGNSNVQIARVAMQVTSIAQRANVAAFVLHHLRKGATGDPDDLMGAVALRANFRACRIMQAMSSDDGKHLGIAETERFRYLRITSGKANYAPPPNEAHWFELISIKLGNPDGIYTEGDSLAVAATWTPPAPIDGVSWKVVEAIFGEIRQGPAEGERYSPMPQAKNWAGHLIAGLANRTPDQAASILKEWIKDGVLNVEPWKNPKHRRTTQGLTVNEALAAQMARPNRADPEWLQ